MDTDEIIFRENNFDINILMVPEFSFKLLSRYKNTSPHKIITRLIIFNKNYLFYFIIIIIKWIVYFNNVNNISLFNA